MQSATFGNSKRKSRRGALRAFGCAAIVSLSVMALGVPVARARAEHALRTTGLVLLRQLGPELVGPPQAVDINGERMWLASTVTSLSVPRVLGEFERQCQPFLASSAVDQDGVGQLACLAGSVAREPMSLLERVREFTESGDLSRLGDARYIVARQDTTSGNTHVLSVWTEGRFNLRAMFPKSSDVPGGDSKDVPRPVDSVRILSARMVDRPYALHMYASEQSSTEVLGYYARELGGRGFFAFEASGASDARAFVKDGASVIVATSSMAKGSVCVSLLEFGSPGYVGAQAKEAP